MSASRSSSMHALKRFATAGSNHATTTTRTQVRRLHMLDPAVFPATTAAKKAPKVASTGDAATTATASSINASSPASVAGAGMLHTASAPNSTSGARPSSPTASSTASVDVSFQSRHFTTSRSVANAQESSSIDSAYLPQYSHFSAQAPGDSFSNLRVPLVPWNFETTGKPPLESEVEVPTAVHRPIIATVSGDGTHISAPSAMSEIVDSTFNFDFHDLTASLTSAARNSLSSSNQYVSKQATEAQGVVRRVWNGILEDVFGNPQANTGNAGKIRPAGA